jgi:hypothetical protein
MYAELINRTWARFKTAQEKFQAVTSFLPVVVFILMIWITPIHWDNIQWVDLVLLLIVIIPTLATVGIALRADKIYLSISARKLSYDLIKYQRWDESSKKYKAQAKKERAILARALKKKK